MAYANLTPNLQDMFNQINDRLRKLESGPNSAQYAADAAQSTAYNSQNVATQALQASTAAQTTANGKNAIYRQGTTPTTPYTGSQFVVGDMWFNTSSDNAISTWNGTTWGANSLGTNALANFSANKITSGTIDASVVNVSNINAGNISTGYLASGRIAASTITGSQIVAGSITTDRLTAGTLTGYTIQTASSGNYIQLTGSSNSLDFYVGSSATAHIVPLSTYGVIIHYGSSPDGSGGTFPQMYVGSGNVSLAANTSNLIGVSTGGISVTGTTTLTGLTYASGNRTGTSSTSNTFFNSTTGFWTYSTASSERYKNSIVDLTTVPEFAPSKILELRPRAFKYNNDYLQPDDQRYDALIPGFISEEMAEVLPIAVDIQDGKIETWNERMLIPGIIGLLQDHETRLAKLEGK